MKDHFSRYCWLRPLNDKTMEEVTNAVREVFLVFGYPRIFQTDNGKEFINDLMKVHISILPLTYKMYIMFKCDSFVFYIQSLMMSYNIKFVHGRAFHSQSQGSVEQMNGVVEVRLSKCIP